MTHPIGLTGSFSIVYSDLSMPESRGKIDNSLVIIPGIGSDSRGLIGKATKFFEYRSIWLKVELRLSHYFLVIC